MGQESQDIHKSMLAAMSSPMGLLRPTDIYPLFILAERFMLLRGASRIYHRTAYRHLPARTPTRGHTQSETTLPSTGIPVSSSDARANESV
jgi:hypothetical protein